MSINENLQKRREAVLPRGIMQVNLTTAASAKGATLIDAEGRELLDFAGGIGVMTIGHGHPAVVRAIQDQAEKLLHACIHVATYEPYIALCEKLAALLAHGGPTKVMLTNSGVEAVENAVKIARQATGRSALICYTEAFHGRTLLGMSLTSKTANKVGCGPFAPEVYRLPYPNHYRYGDGLSLVAFVDRELQRLRQALVNTVPAEHVAAVIIEVIQGEGGFICAPPDYIRGLRKICDEKGIMVIADEVQSGFCRTGKWAAYEHAGIVPDISCWAKALGGGLPIGAVIGRAAIMDAAKPGTLGGTYSGNPVACAAALAALQVMAEQNLRARAESIGNRLRERLGTLQSYCPAVGDVRGLGAMVALELVENGDARQPAKALVTDIVKSCLQRGLLIVPAGADVNIIRILVPLVVSDAELDRGLEILIEEIERHSPP